MSRKAKNLSKASRLREKRARKNANRTKYEAWKREGTNLKGSRKRKSATGGFKGTHPFFCGNLACPKCYPKYNQKENEYGKF